MIVVVVLCVIMYSIYYNVFVLINTTISSCTTCPSIENSKISMYNTEQSIYDIFITYIKYHNISINTTYNQYILKLISNSNQIINNLKDTIISNQTNINFVFVVGGKKNAIEFEYLIKSIIIQFMKPNNSISLKNNNINIKFNILTGDGSYQYILNIFKYKIISPIINIQYCLKQINKTFIVEIANKIGYNLKRSHNAGLYGFSKLFLPFIFSNIDKAIYLDTDMLLLQNPIFLWQYLDNSDKDNNNNIYDSNIEYKYPKYHKSLLYHYNFKTFKQRQSIVNELKINNNNNMDYKNLYWMSYTSNHFYLNSGLFLYNSKYIKQQINNDINEYFSIIKNGMKLKCSYNASICGLGDQDIFVGISEI